MKKLISASRTLAFLLAAAFVLSSVGDASSSVRDASLDPAFVLNSGRDGFTGFLVPEASGGFTGTCDATIVVTPSGRTNFRCSGIVDGSPPDDVFMATETFGEDICTLVITPSGRFRISCH